MYMYMYVFVCVCVCVCVLGTIPLRDVSGGNEASETIDRLFAPIDFVKYKII